MKLGVLFSGGKDSMFAAYLAKMEGYELACLISIFSENKESFMFHTPSISKVGRQAEVMNLPIIVEKTKGEKEIELKDLKRAIKSAKEKYGVEGILTGAVESVYQASRIQKICDELDLECFNPLWQKPEQEILEDLIKNRFKVIITGIFSEGLYQSMLGKVLDREFIDRIKEANKKFGVHLAGEGGEFETFVLDCPLFKHKLKVKDYKITKEGTHSWRAEIEVK
jgi:diphthine-ammonia ligase